MRQNGFSGEGSFTLPLFLLSSFEIERDLLYVVLAPHLFQYTLMTHEPPP